MDGKKKAFASVLLAFFVMGFVDMVGTATNYVKADFALSDTVANFLPSMVFFWFFFLSVPTSLLMGRIGKRKTVMLSLAVTALAMLPPMLSYRYGLMLVSFALLGIGNTLMQVSLNPLVGLLVSGDKLASRLTFGQFVKAIASFITPLLTGWMAVSLGDWKIIYPSFMAVSVLSLVVMWRTELDEGLGTDDKPRSSFRQCLSLLGDGTILLLFFGIVSHVGIDVGVNTCVPKIIMERIGSPLEKATMATSVYFLFRTVGALSGTFILSRMDLRKFFAISAVMIVLAVAGLFAGHSLWAIYLAAALVGYGNSNVFSMILSTALLARPDKGDEVSGLMIMGLIGGAIFPLLMGILSDALGSQVGSVLVISIGAAYLVYVAFWFFKRKAA